MYLLDWGYEKDTDVRSFDAPMAEPSISGHTVSSYSDSFEMSLHALHGLNPGSDALSMSLDRPIIERTKNIEVDTTLTTRGS